MSKRTEPRRGDLVLFYGKVNPRWYQRLLRKAILWGSRSPKEGRTRAHHTGIMVSPTHYISAEDKVRMRRLVNGERVVVYDPGMPWETARAAAQYMENSLGKGYGYFKYPAFLLDEKLFGGRTVFRRLPVDKHPICSTLVAHAYDVAGQRIIQKHPEGVSPDDLDDYAVEHLAEVFRHPKD